MAYADHTTDHSGNNRSVGANVADKAADLADKAGQQLDNVVGKAETTLRSLADQGNEAGERVQEVAGHMKTAIEKSVTDQPMTTLVVAALMGFALGALWKS